MTVSRGAEPDKAALLLFEKALERVRQLPAKARDATIEEVRAACVCRAEGRGQGAGSSCTNCHRRAHHGAVLRWTLSGICVGRMQGTIRPKLFENGYVFAADATWCSRGAARPSEALAASFSESKVSTAGLLCRAHTVVLLAERLQRTACCAKQWCVSQSSTAGQEAQGVGRPVSRGTTS